MEACFRNLKKMFIKKLILRIVLYKVTIADYKVYLYIWKSDFFPSELWLFIKQFWLLETIFHTFKWWTIFFSNLSDYVLFSRSFCPIPTWMIGSTLMKLPR